MTSGLRKKYEEAARELSQLVRIPKGPDGEFDFSSDSSLFRTPRRVEISPQELTEASRVAQKMESFLRRYREITGSGRALAANQIGEDLAIMVFLNQDGTFDVFINPEIVRKSEERNIYHEMCLSGSPMAVDVIRPARIKAKWYDLEGIEHEEELEGFEARKFQHEQEHLLGKVCYHTNGTVESTLAEIENTEVYLSQKLRPVGGPS